MKTFAFIFYLVTLLLSVGCSKSNSSEPAPVNCDGLITDTIGTGDPAKIYMFNAFTPNGDGLNDLCRPVTQNIASISFTVYDTANNVVFQTTQLGEGWITTIASMVATKYFYKIQAVTTSNHKIGKCGEVYKLACFPGSMSPSFFFFEDQLTPNGFTGVTAESLPICP